MFRSIIPLPEEVAMVLPGDTLISQPTAVIDSAFDLPATPDVVYPWFVQLGKQRAGWYLPHQVERFVPRSKRGARRIEEKWQHLQVGQRIPDYGGKEGYLECFYLEPSKTIGYTSERGKVKMTWVLTFWPRDDRTRVLIRLRIQSSGKLHFLLPLGKVFDRLTIAGLAAGLRERLEG